MAPKPPSKAHRFSIKSRQEQARARWAGGAFLIRQHAATYSIIDQRLPASMIRALSPGSPCGGIGRRGRLKICCRKRRASSTLAGGTNPFNDLDAVNRFG